MVGNGNDKQITEYAEICKIIKEKARADIRKYKKNIMRETTMASKSLKNIRRKQKLGQDKIDHTPRSRPTTGHYKAIQ